MNIEPTTDRDFITECVTSDKAWPYITDDDAPARELYFPDMNHLWLKAEDAGVFMLHPHNFVTWEVHTILPFSRGRALDAAKSCIRWVFENTKCMRLITNVPDFNKAALRLAKNAGMEVIGINKKSFMKDGTLHDQTLLGVSKGG